MRLAMAVGAFILTLDGVALLVAMIAADPSTRDWVLPLLFAAFGSAGVVGAFGVAVYVWRKWGNDA